MSTPSEMYAIIRSLPNTTARDIECAVHYLACGKRGELAQLTLLIYER